MTSTAPCPRLLLRVRSLAQPHAALCPLMQRVAPACSSGSWPCIQLMSARSGCPMQSTNVRAAFARTTGVIRLLRERLPGRGSRVTSPAVGGSRRIMWHYASASYLSHASAGSNVHPAQPVRRVVRNTERDSSPSVPATLGLRSGRGWIVLGLPARSKPAVYRLGAQERRVLAESA